MFRDLRGLPSGSLIIRRSTLSIVFAALLLGGFGIFPAITGTVSAEGIDSSAEYVRDVQVARAATICSR